MCGRYSLTTPVEAVRGWFAFVNSLNLPPRFNIAPTQDAPIIALDAGCTVLRMARWGLVPPWAREILPKPLINARAETAFDKPAFQAGIRRHRCLVPADGFYEWQAQPQGKAKPFRICRPDGGLFAMAGIWSHWTDPKSADELISFAVLTTKANDKLRALHERMPVILDGADRERWLTTREEEAATLLPLLKPADNDYFRFYPVSDRVGRVAEDDSGLIAPLDTPPEGGSGQLSLL